MARENLVNSLLLGELNSDLEARRKMARALTQCLRKFPQILSDIDLISKKNACDWRNRDCRFFGKANRVVVTNKRISQMFIHELTYAECSHILKHSSVGRLACTRDNQPYVVPIHFAFDGDYIYGFTTFGQKIAWMRSNPQVCLEVDEESSDQQWTSIIVFGRYEELSDTPEHTNARNRAYEFLQKRVMWWEPAYISQAQRDQPHSLIPIFYRIHIDKMTGHRATSDASQPVTAAMQSPTVKRRWFQKLLHT